MSDVAFDEADTSFTFLVLPSGWISPAATLPRRLDTSMAFVHSTSKTNIAAVPTLLPAVIAKKASDRKIG
jgi:hypothetical protein